MKHESSLNYIFTDTSFNTINGKGKEEEYLSLKFWVRE